MPILLKVFVRINIDKFNALKLLLRCENIQNLNLKLTLIFFYTVLSRYHGESSGELRVTQKNIVPIS